MPRSTTALPGTRSSNRSSRAKIGAGVMWTRCRCDVQFHESRLPAPTSALRRPIRGGSRPSLHMARAETLPAGEVLMEEGRARRRRSARRHGDGRSRRLPFVRARGTAPGQCQQHRRIRILLDGALRRGVRAPRPCGRRPGARHAQARSRGALGGGPFPGGGRGVRPRRAAGRVSKSRRSTTCPRRSFRSRWRRSPTRGFTSSRAIP